MALSPMMKYYLEVKEKYKDEFWVKENAKKFDTDFGSFKFTIETLGLELSYKMTNSEYNKTHRM